MSAKDRFEQIDHSLELDESLRLHAAERAAQRIAGPVILVIVVAALFGLFGDGKIVNTAIRGETATLRYDRVLRASKETVLEFDVTGNAQIAIPFAYFRDFKLEHVVPEPRETRITGDAALYVFEPATAATLRFHVVPRGAGVIRAVIEVDRAAFPVRHVVLP